MNLRSVARQALGKIRPAREPIARLVEHLQVSNALCVIDAGANQGDYGVLLRRFGWAGEILSLEPLAESYEACHARARNDRAWRVMQVGLSDSNREDTMNVASNRQGSSSLHRMGHRHFEAAPEVREVCQEQVHLRKLDDLLQESEISLPFFLKLDVQGHELSALEGGQKVIENYCAGVQVELSLLPLYEESPSLPDVWNWLTERNFRPGWSAAGFRDARTNELLQVDVSFFRTG